jgi:hypothetical protein
MALVTMNMNWMPRRTMALLQRKATMQAKKPSYDTALTFSPKVGKYLPFHRHLAFGAASSLWSFGGMSVERAGRIHFRVGTEIVVEEHRRIETVDGVPRRHLLIG